MSVILNTSTVTSKYQLPDYTTKENVVSSNQSATENMTVEFTKVRSSTRQYVIAGEEVEVVLTLTNNSAREVENVRIVDTIENASFVTGSMTIDETPYVDYVASNYQLPNAIGVGASTVVKYKIKIAETPTTDIANTVSSITYDVAEVTDLNEQSNVLDLTITSNKLKIEKTSDKVAVISGQKIIFQNIISNEGEYTNTEVNFKDPMPAGTKFVPGSVKIDDVVDADANPEVGISLNDIGAGESIKVTFEVTVD